MTVIEKDTALGGKLRTVTIEGTRVEAGADSFIAREPHGIALAEDVGLGRELVEPGVFGGLVWDGRRLKDLPRDAFMGIPKSPRALWQARNLSLFGKLRGLGDLVLGEEIDGDDVATGPFLRRRFGRQVTYRMVDPILAGTRSGDIENLSLRYALPQVFKAAASGRSVMRTLGSGPASGPPRFRTPRSGMSSFVEAVAASAPMEIRTSHKVASVTRLADGRYALLSEGGEAHNFDAVIVALPAHQAAGLFGAPRAPIGSSAVDALRAIPHASVASVALAYRESDITFPADSSGFLVPSTAQRTLAAGTWWSLKWPHTKSKDLAVVRCFVGRSGHHPALDLDDQELAGRAAQEIAEITGSEAPVAHRVDRWPDGLPQFEVGHHDRLRTIGEALSAAPGLEMAGPDLTGSGVPECIKQGTEAALRTVAYLATRMST